MLRIEVRQTEQMTDPFFFALLDNHVLVHCFQLFFFKYICGVFSVMSSFYSQETTNTLQRHTRVCFFHHFHTFPPHLSSSSSSAPSFLCFPCPTHTHFPPPCYCVRLTCCLLSSLLLQIRNVTGVSSVNEGKSPFVWKLVYYHRKPTSFFCWSTHLSVFISLMNCICPEL